MNGTANSTIGLLLFPGLTQLDLTGPYEVFSRIPGSKVYLIWKTLMPVASDRGMTILPTVTFASCPPLDIICIPGGPGQIQLMEDSETLSFIQRVSEQARFITSVCTGSLILGAAGLLQGYRATTHWAVLDQLALLGAEPVNERVVWDGNRVTGAGVTSGIDFALSIVAKVYGKEIAQQIQLQIEYDPAPPFSGGSVRTASAQQLANAKAASAQFNEKRGVITLKAAAKLAKKGRG